MRTIRFAAALAALALWTLPAFSADAPLWSLSRFSLAAQAGAGTYQDLDSDFSPNPETSFHAALVPSWNLGTNGALNAPLKLDATSQLVSFEPKFSVAILSSGRFAVAAQAGYAWLAHIRDGYAVESEQEAIAGASLAVELRKRLYLTFPARVGLDSREATVDARISWDLIPGGG